MSNIFVYQKQLGHNFTAHCNGYFAYNAEGICFSVLFSRTCCTSFFLGYILSWSWNGCRGLLLQECLLRDYEAGEVLSDCKFFASYEVCAMKCLMISKIVARWNFFALWKLTIYTGNIQDTVKNCHGPSEGSSGSKICCTFFICLSAIVKHNNFGSPVCLPTLLLWCMHVNPKLNCAHINKVLFFSTRQ